MHDLLRRVPRVQMIAVFECAARCGSFTAAAGELGMTQSAVSRHIDAFERAILRCDEVMECYLMTGSRDILLRVVARDLTAFDAFLENRLMQIPGIRNLRSNFALRAMVKRDVLPSSAG